VPLGVYLTDVSGTSAKAGPSDADRCLARDVCRLPLVLVICFGSKPPLLYVRR
jgi:hypothetical protein